MICTMEQQYRSLSELDFGSNWIAVKVRIGRLWYSISQANEVYTINMQLLDCKGNQKAVLVPKHLVMKFKGLLDEGKIYEIRRFNAWDSKPDYKAIDENWTIHIMGDTSIKLINENDERIPRYKFGFVHDDNVLASRANRKEQLTDVYGIITGYSNLIPVTTQLGIQKNKRELELEIKGYYHIQQSICFFEIFTYSFVHRGKSAIVTLWGEKTSLVDEFVMLSVKKPVTAVITSTTVSNYNAKFSYSSTLATKIYLNISIPEIDDIVESSKHSSNGAINLIQNSMSTKTVVAVDSSLAEMMSDVWNSNCEFIMKVKDTNVEVAQHSLTNLKLGLDSVWKYLMLLELSR